MSFANCARQKNNLLIFSMVLMSCFAAIMGVCPTNARASMSQKSKKYSARCKSALTDVVPESPYELVPLSPEFVGEELGIAKIFRENADEYIARYYRERKVPQIPYLNARAREAFKAHVVEGGLRYRISEKAPFFSRFNPGTLEHSAIYSYIMDAQGNIYLRRLPESGRKVGLGYFHMSGIIAGAPVAAAGTMKILNGQILCVWTGSMVYNTGNIHMQQLMRRLKELGADLSETEFFFNSPF